MGVLPKGPEALSTWSLYQVRRSLWLMKPNSNLQRKLLWGPKLSLHDLTLAVSFSSPQQSGMAKPSCEWCPLCTRFQSERHVCCEWDLQLYLRADAFGAPHS